MKTRLSEKWKTVPGTHSGSRSGGLRLGELSPPLGGIPLSGNRRVISDSSWRGLRNSGNRRRGFFRTLASSGQSGPGPIGDNHLAALPQMLRSFSPLIPSTHSAPA